MPIQAGATHKGKPAAYVLKGGQAEPRPVEVGMFNTKFIEITKGLKPGDRILLSPPFESREKDLEGGVLAENEKPRAATNAPPRAAPPNISPGEPIAVTGGDRKGDSSRKRGKVNPEEMLKRFDKNGDGKLDEEELAAMRASSSRGQGVQGKGPARRGGTGATDTGGEETPRGGRPPA